jgi:protoporphyrinogen oxidase
VRESWVFSHGVYTRYPFQANTYGLPAEVVKDCVLGLVEAQSAPRRRLRSFEDWILATFGRGIAEHFMLPYNTKLWTVPPSRMCHEWTSFRVPRPRLDEVLDGALREQPKQFGPNAQFLYPRKGGIGAIAEALAPRVGGLELGKRVVGIDLRRKAAVTESGETFPFSKLISTAPLPSLVGMMRDAPAAVKEAARNLMYNKVLVVNLGIDRDKMTFRHWVYYPEKQYPFYRASFPSELAPGMAPPGKSSVTVEISSPGRRPAAAGGRERVVDGVIDALASTGLFGKDEVEVRDVRLMDPAYVIYDHAHRRNVSVIHRFLRKKGIIPAGRFGEWEYLNMDHALISGKLAAEEALGRRNAAHGYRTPK